MVENGVRRYRVLDFILWWRDAKQYKHQLARIMQIICREGDLFTILCLINLAHKSTRKGNVIPK